MRVEGDQGLVARAARRLDGLAPGEHAQVALGGDEALAKEVGEEGALPVPPRLRSVTLVTPVCVMREGQLTGLDC